MGGEFLEILNSQNQMRAKMIDALLWLIGCSPLLGGLLMLLYEANFLRPLPQ